MTKQTIGSIVIIAFVLLVMAYLLVHYSPFHKQTDTGSSALNVTYFCQEGKIISALFNQNSVLLTLSDGRNFALPQTTSGSGIRYEETINGKDETFLSKGNTALITEENQPLYANCIAGKIATQANGLNTFTDQSLTFSLTYPSQFSISGGDVGYTSAWSQNATSSGLLLAVIHVPQSYQPGTNFSEATFTVGTSPDPAAVAECTKPPQLATEPSTQVTIQGTLFTKFHYTDAGAGNYYDTTTYRTVRNNQCYAIEYTVHSTNLGNYSPEQGITAFNSQTVTSSLDAIALSFTFI